MSGLKILMSSSEAVPFIKTGGLADVAGALPQSIAGLGHEVKVVLPLYRAIDKSKYTFHPVELKDGDHFINIADTDYKLEAISTTDQKTGVQFIFIKNDYYFDREGIYLDKETGEDYPDNDERYAFFGRAVLELARAIDYHPDIIHLHDWQSAMTGGYLRTLYADDPFFEKTRTIFTIHNIGYQGHFPQETFAKLGLDEGYYAPGSPFEYWEHVNYLKVGITTADIITTVSETYAQEIQSGNDMGFGMEGILYYLRDSLFGVLNGVDYEVWSPENDTLIPFNFSVKDFSNKHKNKQSLLNMTGLESSNIDKPLIGVISRLADQKGFDLIEKISDELFMLDFQMVLLGTGDSKYHALFEALQQIHPRKIKAFLTFDNKLAHLIEAGSDMFLMPSLYEPCGLNQMYSLKYGTVPIVRKTGGLADTVIDYNENPDSGNGFVFEDYEPEELLDTIKRALTAYQNQKIWREIMLRGMIADHSWDASAVKYVDIYQHALNLPKSDKLNFHVV